jgi:hypothetical protein
LPNENVNGTTSSKDEATSEVTPVLEEISTKPVKRADSKREKRISFRGNHCHIINFEMFTKASY